MNALILAAGFSTRLYPLTKDIPKALLPVGGKALCQYMLDGIAAVPGITERVLITNDHYAPQFQTWLTKTYPVQTFKLLSNGIKHPDKRNGAIGDIAYALEKTGWQEDVLIVASDTLASVSFSGLVKFFKTHHGVVNCVYDISDTSKIAGKLGCVEMKANRIVAFTEKPKHPETTITSIPYYIYPKRVLPDLFEYKKRNGSMDAPGSIMSWFIGRVPVYGYMVQGYYYDVGTVDAYREVRRGSFLI